MTGPVIKRGFSVALIGLAVLCMFAVFSLPAEAAAPAVAQESPYDPPELVQVDLPGWAEPFGPLARFPLWAQAGLASAAVAGLVFLMPLVSRWLWALGDDEQRASESGE